MYKYFAANNTYKYIDVLPDLINEYNNHKHSTIKMTPTEVSMKYNEKVIQNDVYSIHDKTIYKSKFMVGDRVRIRKYKRTLFDKGIHQTGVNKFCYSRNTTYQSYYIYNKRLSQ